LFANWFFTKEGMKVMAESTEPPTNSRRKDLPVYDPETYPDPNVKLYNNSKESSIADLEVTQKLLEQIVGVTNR
jgi:hypothetical protein